MLRPLALLALVACNTPIGPDPDTTTGSTSSTGAGGNGGNGGDGGTSQGGAPATGGGGTSGTGGSAPMPGLGYENGSRLRAVVWQAVDGARQFAAWHDSQLDVDCTFALANDDEVHCMPSTYVSSTAYFANPSCTAKALTITTCPSTSPTYATEPLAGCPTRYKAHHITGPLTSVYQQVGASCVVVSPPPPNAYADLGDESADTFVTAQRDVE